LYATYTGIDVSKRELVCQFMDREGEILRSTLTVGNNYQGALQLCRTIRSLVSADNHPDLHVGMEATNAYWYRAEQAGR